MNSSKQILLLVFISVFCFQNTYSQIPDSIELTYNPEHKILIKNVKYRNFFDVSDVFYFQDTLFDLKLKNYLFNKEYIISSTGVNFTESNINQFGFNVNPDFMNIRLSQSPADKILFKHFYRAFDIENRIKPPIFDTK